jgi:hypothetical protein
MLLKCVFPPSYIQQSVSAPINLVVTSDIRTTKKLLSGLQRNCYPDYKVIVIWTTKKLLSGLQINCYPDYKESLLRLQRNCYPDYKEIVTGLQKNCYPDYK